MEKIREFVTPNGIKAVHVTEIPTLNIFKTFDCGQCFRFESVSVFGNRHEFGGVAFRKYVIFAQNHENEIIIYNSSAHEYESTWRGFLSLDTDYDKINGDILCAVPEAHMKRAIEYGNGIRILSQNLWESIVSFIISQNNNIPRIKKIISAICEKYGEKIQFLDNVYYSFPDSKTLSRVTEQELFELKMGFRAKYVADACKKFCEREKDFLCFGQNGTIEDCMSFLCEIKGIGPKVASCILLFGAGRGEAFPIDVHMKRTLEKYFPNGINLEALGKNAGITQQYLFYYEKYSQNS